MRNTWTGSEVGRALAEVDWDATPGSHTITARSTDVLGDVQPEERAEPLPDGASGWHSVVVIVS